MGKLGDNLPAFGPRGLGIRSMRDINQALLNKWLWRFRYENQASWRQWIVAKYGEERMGWISGTPLGPAGCGVWKGIREGL